MIRLLKNHPSDLRIVGNSYEAGYDDRSPKQIIVENIELNTVGTNGKVNTQSQLINLNIHRKITILSMRGSSDECPTNRHPFKGKA